MSKRIAIFDMDLFAYRSAAAVEERKIKVTHLATAKTKLFKTRTDFKKFLNEKDIEYNEDKYHIEDIQIAEDVSHALNIIKLQVNKIKTAIGADMVYGFIGKGSDNFRLNLDLPKQYKGQREEMLKPLHLDKTRKFIVDNYNGGYVEGIEVDDEVIIRSHLAIAKGNDPVIITIDKDCTACVGTKFYNWMDEFPDIIEVPKFGYLDYIKKDKGNNKVKGLGLNFLMYQLLHEDAADNYGVNDLHSERFGAASVVKYLNQAKTVNDLFALTEAKYQEWFGDAFTYTTHDGRTVTKNYKEILDMYFKCAYMLRSRNDTTNFYSLWEEMK